MPFSAACERTRGPILEQLGPLLRDRRDLLEIGSGTGQHAVFFAAAMPWLRWQATERAPALRDLRRRIRLEGPPEQPSPVELDVGQSAPWPRPAGTEHWHAAFSANTLHIMSEAMVERTFAGLGAVLAPGAPLAVYGPFCYAGRFTSDSNALFDAQLRERDPASGIRDVEWLDAIAARHGLGLEADHAMPANNRLRIWRLGTRSSGPRAATEKGKARLATGLSSGPSTTGRAGLPAPTAAAAPAAAAAAVSTAAAAATAAVAAATTAAAAIATATAATAAIAAATAAARTTRAGTILRLVDAQRTTPHGIAVQRLDRPGRIGLGHFNETEAARAARFAVDRQRHGLYRAVLGEQVPNRGFVSRERQIAYVDFRHLLEHQMKNTHTTVGTAIEGTWVRRCRIAIPRAASWPPDR